MIQATLGLIHCARAAGHFDRYVLLSGSCYPVKPISVLEAKFAEDPTREWISLTPIARDSHLAFLIGRRWRMAPLLSPGALDKTIRSGWNKVTKLIGRDLGREIQMTPYFGSQWWALTDDCIATILEFLRSHPNFESAYRSVYAPDEHFFHTIIGNSRFLASAQQVEDRGSATNQVAPLHLIAAAEDRFYDSDEDTFARVAATKSFFIRKVSTNRSSALLDRIDRELLCAAALIPSMSSKG